MTIISFASPLAKAGTSCDSDASAGRAGVPSKRQMRLWRSRPALQGGDPRFGRRSGIGLDRVLRRQAGNLVWPSGFRARFVPKLKILDVSGRVVARDGDLATGECPMSPSGVLIDAANAAPKSPP